MDDRSLVASIRASHSPSPRGGGGGGGGGGGDGGRGAAAVPASSAVELGGVELQTFHGGASGEAGRDIVMRGPAVGEDPGGSSHGR